ncbi:hypothetical protein C8A05DRAFT_40712 [Staphylotrichum tortipilum]|uniref:DUF2293 domain-containing protein n=1 Tax=Staphylotrichum tortipilum TaxID=2831512 RepID=A0AAN6MV49_9PEZI|nr:hypothetical protein C8A05DRAFT_40712 [Staphylotrichum longicolle]
MPKWESRCRSGSPDAEFEVRATTPTASGCTFNCPKKTHEAGKILYVVIDKSKRPIGLRCPAYIHELVVSQGRVTARQRAAAVLKRDTAIEENFEEALLKLFPKTLNTDVPQVLKHALKKHSRRLAVHAHIRHVHTDYDRLLREGLSKSLARGEVWDQLSKVARQSGRQAPKPAAEAPSKDRRRRKDMKRAAPGMSKQPIGAMKEAVPGTASHRWKGKKEAFMKRTPRTADGLELPEDGSIAIIDGDEREVAENAPGP